MVWTKLSYLNFSQVFSPTKVGNKWVGAAVNSRYRQTLKKEFLKAGVPWEYDPTHFEKRSPMHPYERPPKVPRNVKNKRMRVAKIERALAKQDDLQLKYRQETANKKRLTGLDFLFVSSLGSLLRTK
jgi:hypothetical protein